MLLPFSSFSSKQLFAVTLVGNPLLPYMLDFEVLPDRVREDVYLVHNVVENMLDQDIPHSHLHIPELVVVEEAVSMQLSVVQQLWLYFVLLQPCCVWELVVDFYLQKCIQRSLTTFQRCHSSRPRFYLHQEVSKYLDTFRNHLESSHGHLSELLFLESLSWLVCRIRQSSEYVWRLSNRPIFCALHARCLTVSAHTLGPVDVSWSATWGWWSYIAICRSVDVSFCHGFGFGHKSPWLIAAPILFMSSSLARLVCYAFAVDWYQWPSRTWHAARLLCNRRSWYCKDLHLNVDVEHRNRQLAAFDLQLHRCQRQAWQSNISTFTIQNDGDRVYQRCCRSRRWRCCRWISMRSQQRGMLTNCSSSDSSRNVRCKTTITIQR